MSITLRNELHTNILRTMGPKRDINIDHRSRMRGVVPSMIPKENFILLPKFTKLIKKLQLWITTTGR